MNNQNESTLKQSEPIAGMEAPRPTLEADIVKQEKRLLDLQKAKELKDAAQPLVDFLKKHYHPHARVIVEVDHVEVVSGEMRLNF